jgi:hypothetical protein
LQDGCLAAILTLGEKIEGQNSTLFHQGLNIISPGIDFFLRFEGPELTIFSLLCKKGQEFDTSVTLERASIPYILDVLWQRNWDGKREQNVGSYIVVQLPNHIIYETECRRISTPHNGLEIY